MLLKRVGEKTIELHHLLAVNGVATGVAAEDRTQLHIAGHLHSERRLEVANILEALATYTSHRIVVAVKSLLSIDRFACPVWLSPQQRKEGGALYLRRNGESGCLQNSRQNIHIANQLGNR